MYIGVYMKIHVQNMFMCSRYINIYIYICIYLCTSFYMCYGYMHMIRKGASNRVKPSKVFCDILGVYTLWYFNITMENHYFEWKKKTP